MKSSFNLVIRGSKLLFAWAFAVCAFAAYGAVTERATAGEQTLIELGDTNSTLLTTNWEMDLDNADANDDQMSMAVAGDALYVCICRYVSPGVARDNVVFLRRYSLADGKESELFLDAPEGFVCGKNNHHTIVADDAGHLVVAMVSSAPGADGNVPRHVTSARLTMYAIDMQTGTPFIDASTMAVAEIPVSFSNYEGVDYYSDLCWMERIHWLGGDFLSGEYSFATTIGGGQPDENGGYAYEFVELCGGQASDGGYRHIAVTDRTPLAIDKAEASDTQNCSPDVAYHPGGDRNHLVVTRNMYFDRSFLPTIYTGGSGTSEAMAIDAASPNCRGFHPFVHNGHVLAAYATRHDGDGAQFALVSWPQDGTFAGATKLAAIPSVAFSGAQPIYSAVRQLALAVPSSGNGIMPMAEGASPGVATDLYLYAPGSGVGSYTLFTPQTPTSVASIEAPRPIVQIDGRTVSVIADSVETLGIRLVDLSGRTVISVPPSHGNCTVDLSSLASGTYLLLTGQNATKITLR